PPPLVRSAQLGLSDRPVADRPGIGPPVRGGAGSQPADVDVRARRPHGLRRPADGGGARPDPRAYRAGPVRTAGLPGSAGGPAGHVDPGLALAGELRGRGHSVEFAGTETGPEGALVPAAGFALRAIRARPVRRRLAPSIVVAPMVALRATAACAALVKAFD